MAGSNPIYYKDLVSPDDSIERLIKELTDLKSTYGEVVDLVKKNAIEIQTSLKNVSGATDSGRESIKKAVSDVSLLEKAEKELSYALSETGARVQELKVLTGQANKENKDAAKLVNSVSNSYNAMNAELTIITQQLKNLNTQQALTSTEGAKLINRIVELKSGMKQYDDAVKLRIQSQIQYNKELASSNSSDEARKSVLAQLTLAEEKLTFARSSENEQLKLYSTLIREANQEAKLNATITASADGSYDKLSAQYSLNSIKLNKMSAEERNAAESGKLLEQQTADIYKQMIKLQEATGNYKLSVGNYKKSWDGLGMSVSQIVRELPAAAVSLNTFFLGISNNVPILADEIQRLREQNKAFAAEGLPTKNVIGAIVKALFGWNTILVIILTVFSMFGKDIISWVGNLFKGEKAVLSLSDATKKLNEELSKNSNQYGSNLIKFKQLATEWKNIGENVKEQKQWIIDNKTAFNQLDIEITSVNDATNVFVQNTAAFIEALKLRAKATAASSLASKKYEEALVLEDKAKLESEREYTFLDKQIGYFKAVAGRFLGTNGPLSLETRMALQRQENVKGIKKEKEAIEEEADRFFELSQSYTDMADAQLKAANIDSSHKNGGKGKKEKRDAFEYINRMELSTRKKYQESITRLEKDEFAKRRKEAFDTYNANTGELMNTYEKNKRILADEGKLYKKLTDEQKQQIKDSQEIILKTVESYQDEFEQTVIDIQKDAQINELNILEQTISLKLEAIKKGSEEELKLRIQSLNAQEKIALLENSKLPKNKQVSESDIKKGFSKKTSSLMSEFNYEDFQQQQDLEEARFNVVKRTENNITRFKLQQEKDRWLQQIALAKAGSLDWSQTQIDTAIETVKKINREIAESNDFLASIGKNGLGYSLLESFGFNDDQIDAFTDATNIVISQLQSIMQAEVDLAQAATDTANKRAEAAQSALDAELEARNAGYASSVVAARKELEQARKQQREKQRMLKDAQQSQEQIDTLMQTSSLITASANIWSSLSKIPIVGPSLALAAIGTMWTSFAFAKVKAKQVASAQSEEYGDGGYEILEGGSHASGNDIDLGIKNKSNRRMKAEGGEALAIINKRSTRKYSNIIPDIVNSLNKGIFEDKYANAFSESDKIVLMQRDINAKIDLSIAEEELRAIRKQGETRYFQGKDGSIIEIKGNVKRIIRE